MNGWWFLYATVLGLPCSFLILVKIAYSLSFWLFQDPDAKKPEDWDDREKLDDPDDTKPEDWDKPEHIPDPDAKKPEDWDDEMDGEWEPPMIDNPDYKVIFCVKLSFDIVSSGSGVVVWFWHAIGGWLVQICMATLDEACTSIFLIQCYCTETGDNFILYF